MRCRLIRLAIVVVVLNACGGNAFELSTGQCLNEPDSEEVVNVEVVECTDPHHLEIYQVSDLADQEFVERTIDSQSFDLCLETFDGFIGTPYIDSDFEIYYLIPSAESWADGDREVVCAVYDLLNDKSTGTAENSNR